MKKPVKNIFLVLTQKIKFVDIFIIIFVIKIQFKEFFVI